ncbi:MAG: aspartate-semialdehyde dehydrogenase [Bacteroidetes bacterium]|nr:aspartate-semialdehyde dehydrogenase [Bacteroidota bacterium]
MRLALAGATGLVGRKMMEILEGRNVEITDFYPVASSKSVGSTLTFQGRDWRVMGMDEALAQKPRVALFSAGGGTSLAWAPKFAQQGCYVIDNSSAWRMDPACPLVVPEINAHLLTPDNKVIANPNCSTIQMVMALHPLHTRYGLRRVVVSTYQSVTGTGKAAVDQLMGERAGLPVIRVYPHSIDLNCIPQCDVFVDNGYTKEEMKLVNETKKILGNQDIRVTATAVRVPVMGGHSESVNVEFNHDFDLDEVRNLLNATPGVQLMDEPGQGQYPMPSLAHERDEVFVGRLRRDESQEKTLNMWIVSDNLRKGAATNAVQILEYLQRNGLV